MILILSKAHYELTTEKVIDWLSFHNANFVRLNGSDFYKLCTLSDFTLKVKGISLDKIKMVWNRRWIDEGFVDDIVANSNFDSKTLIEVQKSISGELKILRNEFFKTLSDRKWLSKLHSFNTTKLENLKIANQVGLQVPETKIFNSKIELEKFLNKHGSIITKPINEVSIFREKNTDKVIFHKLLTGMITLEDVTEMPEVFFPSLFQEYKEKQFEIRTFVLNEKLYSMAIFSQRDCQTKVDFRNYNRKNPNRVVPYKLPEEIEKRIHNFMRHIKLKTGSIDFIKGIDNNYYFLEINPQGQFGMVSLPCNYYLEEKLAKYLINEDS